MSKMLEETRQQPVTLSRTLEQGLRTTRSLQKHFQGKRPRMILLAARGTSDNAAHFGRYLIEMTTGIPVSLAAPSIVTLYGRGLELRDMLVVGISQSGESTDINAVLADARERGAVAVGITNEPRSAMAKIAHEVLLVRAGTETSVAATKTYTGQLLALYLLALALGGHVQEDRLRRIPDWTAAVMKLESRVAETVERYRFMNGTVTVGRGLNYATALEFGLKLMETCYVLAQGFSAADLMHGPIAMVERDFPVFVFAPTGATWPSIAGVLEHLDELKADTLVITDRRNSKARSRSRLIELPAQPGPDNGISDLYTPIPYIIPAQLFAAHLAEVKGLNPDRPRRLSKITRTM
ncbi:MAG: SIS domain-containing protein [Acidobacteriia bacterium]|nr:SIS domain-containing protein [Terriglobia bacterium]